MNILEEISGVLVQYGMLWYDMVLIILRVVAQQRNTVEGCVVSEAVFCSRFGRRTSARSEEKVRPSVTDIDTLKGG